MTTAVLIGSWICKDHADDKQNVIKSLPFFFLPGEWSTCPGGVIFYYSYLFVCGGKCGQAKVVVISTDPDRVDIFYARFHT
jgi:hypothetical protein